MRDRNAQPAPDLVDRKFTAIAPDQLWVADITYVPTWAGFLLVAIVLDVSIRRVVGWAMATRLRTELVLDALNMAIYRRHPTDVIHHSDQGSQDTSIAFSNRCKEAGVRPSMGSVEDRYDNACARASTRFSSENYLSNIASRTRAKRVLPKACTIRVAGHTAIGSVSPIEFERRTHAA